jgi:uncharacterized lipoprotein YajG
MIFAVDCGVTYRKGDCVKKVVIVIIFTLLLAGCQRKENNVTPPISDKVQVDENRNDENQDNVNQNDLVYRDYGTGVKLSDNSKLIISRLDLSLNGEAATIKVINLESDEVVKLFDYEPNQNISYNPDKKGVYKIIAQLNSGELIDLTTQATVDTSFSVENSNGIIQLQ